MVKVIIRGLFALLFTALLGLGGHLTLKKQQEVEAFSEQTTATVTGKQIVSRSKRSGGKTTVYHRPVVSFQYQVEGQTFTSHQIFPHEFEVGGGLGRLSAKAPLDAFEVDQETKAYYNPDDPSHACLIRRPSLGCYAIVLGAMVALSLTLGTWPVQKSDENAKRRKGLALAALWYLVGLAAASHYFHLAGAHCAGEALLLFGLYMVLGLFPLSAAAGGNKSSKLAGRLQAGALGSLIGAFVGIWVGLGLCFVSMRFFRANAAFGVRCMGYGIAVPAALLLFLGLFAHRDAAQDEDGEEQEQPTAQPGR